MRHTLGNLEEMILLILMLVKDEAYGITIREEYIRQTEHKLSLSAIHTVLRRLEKKGYIESYLGGATEVRGGRRKRLYRVNKAGYTLVTEIQENRNRIWKLIPDMDLGIRL